MKLERRLLFSRQGFLALSIISCSHTPARAHTQALVDHCLDIDPLSYLEWSISGSLEVGISFIIYELKGGGRQGQEPFISAI